MDEEDQNDIIDKVKSSGAINGHEHDDEETTYDHDHDDTNGNELEDLEVTDNEEGGEVEENGGIIVNDFNLDKEKSKRSFPTNELEEDVDPHQPLDDDATMDLINKYNPTLVKIGKLYGNNSDLYQRFSKAMSRNDEPFLQKLMKDSGVLFESIKKDSINLDNSKKTITFVDVFKNKLKEHHDMNYTDYLNVDNQEYVTNNEKQPVETPTITPTETPTRRRRTDKPFQVPVIKPGTEPRPKASN